MQGLSKIVLERLKKTAVGGSQNRRHEHPDANLLSAFIEKTLTERERTEVLNHLVLCPGCREIVALARPAEVEVAEAARSSIRQGWSLWSALRWGAVAATLGVVLILAVFHSHLRTRQVAVSKNMGSPIVAKARETAPQPPAELAPQPSLKASAAKAGTGSHESPRKMAELDKRVLAPLAAPTATRPADEEAKRLLRLTVPAAPHAAPATATARTESVAVTAEAHAESAGGITTPANGPRTPAPPLPAPVIAGLPGSASGASVRAHSAFLGLKPQQARMPPTALRAAQPSVGAQLTALWTISPEGKPQRSDDGGKNWESVRVDDTVTFQAIEARGRDVWAGGSGGALYHSSDGGGSWNRVVLGTGGSPATATIVSISHAPSNLSHVTVRTATGERWVSEDGGERWKVVPSEE